MLNDKYLEHYKKNMIVAYPIVLGQAGHIITHIADSMMVGQVGSVDLAAASIANTVFLLPFVLGIGIATGLTPLVGKSFGQKNTENLRELFKAGLIGNMLIAVLLTGVLAVFGGLFNYLGQEPEVVEKAVPYYWMLVASMIPVMLFINYKQYVEGFEVTMPGMVISVLGNGLNIFLNWVFIFGHLGFEPMGLLGAGYATLTSRILMAIAFVAYVHYVKFFKVYIVGLNLLKFNLKKVYNIYKLGIPIGLQFVLEVGAFTTGAVMVGWISAEALAAHQIAISLAALTYLMSGGVASAATIRLSNLVGENKLTDMRIAGYSSLFMVMTFMGVSAILFVALKDFLPTLYVDEQQVITMASSLLLITAFFQLFDGAQVTMLGCLRGIEDVRFPTIVALISYWIIGIPSSYIFGIYMDLGVQGVWYGYVTGLGAAAVVLYIRFEFVSKRMLLKPVLD